jgi:DNA-binding transcriptional regulator of glucitol operon
MGADMMVSEKTLSKSEKAGVWIFFGGFAVQTIHHVVVSQWAALEIVQLMLFVVSALVLYFMFHSATMHH